MLIPTQNLPIHRHRRSKPFEGLGYAEVRGVHPSEYDGDEMDFDDDDEYSSDDSGYEEA